LVSSTDTQTSQFISSDLSCLLNALSNLLFPEAEMAQNRILELKEQEFNMQYQQLVFTHQQRQEDI